MILKRYVWVALAAASLMTPAYAAVTFEFSQSGNDVLLTGSGSVNLAGATTYCCGAQDGYLNSGTGGLAVGGPFGNVSFSMLASRDPAFGTGSYIDGTQDTGDRFGMNAYDGTGYLNLYQGYISGTALNGSTRFVNQTFGSLGLIAGTYTYMLPSDTVTVLVPSPVPEGGTLAMMLLGLGLLGDVARRSARSAAGATGRSLVR
ncbi:MAG: hypothetical protein RLZZ584_896 [Pseudomonadota bacterium]